MCSQKKTSSSGHPGGGINFILVRLIHWLFRVGGQITEKSFKK